MHMGLRDTGQTSESSLRQFAVVNAIPDVGEQPLLRVLERQVLGSSYFVEK
jgi:hypothetical protein